MTDSGVFFTTGVALASFEHWGAGVFLICLALLIETVPDRAPR